MCVHCASNVRPLSSADLSRLSRSAISDGLIWSSMYHILARRVPADSFFQPARGMAKPTSSGVGRNLQEHRVLRSRVADTPHGHLHGKSPEPTHRRNNYHPNSTSDRNTVGAQPEKLDAKGARTLPKRTSRKSATTIHKRSPRLDGFSRWHLTCNLVMSPSQVKV